MLSETEVKRRVKFEAKRQSTLATLAPTIAAANALLAVFTEVRLTVETDEEESPVAVALLDGKRALARIDYRMAAFKSRPSVLQMPG